MAGPCGASLRDRRVPAERPAFLRLRLGRVQEPARRPALRQPLVIAPGADEGRLAVAAGEGADPGLARGELDEEDCGDARQGLLLICEGCFRGRLRLDHRAAPEHLGVRERILAIGAPALTGR